MRKLLAILALTFPLALLSACDQQDGGGAGDPAMQDDRAGAPAGAPGDRAGDPAGPGGDDDTFADPGQPGGTDDRAGGGTGTGT